MRRPTPDNWAGFEYFRRVGGFKAKEALALSRAERWASDSGLELGIELGTAYLHHRRATEEPTESHWQDAGFEFSEPLIVIPRPKGVTNRVTAAILAARLIAESKSVSSGTNVGRESIASYEGKGPQPS